MITTGTILMDRDAVRPEYLELEDGAYPNTWVPVKRNLTSNELENQLSTSGWTLFYLASPISTTAFGFDRVKMIHAALTRLIAQAKVQKCNCLEIDDVSTRSFLGMPYLSVSAHPRHIQRGLVFNGH